MGGQIIDISDKSDLRRAVAAAQAFRDARAEAASAAYLWGRPAPEIDQLRLMTRLIAYADEMADALLDEQ